MGGMMGGMPMRGGMQDQSPGGIQDVMGGPPSPQEGQQQQQPNQEQQMQQVMAAVRDIHQSIEALTRQFPEGAKAARKAKEGLIEMMNVIVSSQKSPEPQAPRVLG